MTRRRRHPPRATAVPRSGRHIAWVAPILVAAVAFVAFLPALQNGFVAWDDDKNFLANPHYRGLGGAQLRWMWTTFHLGHYVPLSWMTLGFDYVLWGMNPAGYHLTNVALHAANTVLFFFIARRLLRPMTASGPVSDAVTLSTAAAVAALLFAIHPLRVESVAWATERRDVLSGLFYSASILLYLRARDLPRLDRRWYWLAVVTCACALLSKATSMTLPAVLFILEVYPLRRLGGPEGWWSVQARRVYRDLLPFGAFAGAAAILSIVALHPPAQLDAFAKVAVSSYSFVLYLSKTIFPVDLSPVYEMPQQVKPLAAKFIVSYVAVVALAAGVWRLRRRWPAIAAAFVAFVVILLPMLGVVQNGPQIAADRYTYHAAPALSVLAGAGYIWLARQGIGAYVRRLAAGAVLVVLCLLTWRQTRVWRDSATLWTHVLRLDDESSIGHVGLATVLFKEDRVDDALSHAQRAVEIAPGYAQARNDLGVGLARKGRLDEAETEYRRALMIEPEYDEARSNWGVVMARRGDLDGAIRQYQQALSDNRDNADAHVNWANALVRLGREDQAIAHYREALRIRPDHADAEHNWGVALAREGKLADAIEHFQHALVLNPRHAEARDYLERAMQLLHEPPLHPTRLDSARRG